MLCPRKNNSNPEVIANVAPLNDLQFTLNSAMVSLKIPSKMEGRRGKRMLMVIQSRVETIKRGLDWDTLRRGTDCSSRLGLFEFHFCKNTTIALATGLPPAITSCSLNQSCVDAPPSNFIARQAPSATSVEAIVSMVSELPTATIR